MKGFEVCKDCGFIDLNFDHSVVNCQHDNKIMLNDLVQRIEQLEQQNRCLLQKEGIKKLEETGEIV